MRFGDVKRIKQSNLSGQISPYCVIESSIKDDLNHQKSQDNPSSHFALPFDFFLSLRMEPVNLSPHGCVQTFVSERFKTTLKAAVNSSIRLLLSFSQAAVCAGIFSIDQPNVRESPIRKGTNESKPYKLYRVLIHSYLS